jgi:predicted GNAT family N-acyltransferase
MTLSNCSVTVGDWPGLKEQAQAIRMEVFVQEQNVPAELEMDQMDAVCIHAIAYDGAGVAVGTGRLLPDGHICRMAVRKSARVAAAWVASCCRC